MEKPSNELLYHYLASFGAFYALDIFFDQKIFLEELKALEDGWVEYNRSKPGFRRYGLSLFSLDGETTGEIDLNSIREWNIKHRTQYDEGSFNQPTRFWKHLTSISSKIGKLEPFLGRSHLIKLEEGGFFPPHRDGSKLNTECFRLCSFLNCSPNSFHLVLDGALRAFNPGQLYFMDTRRIHSVISYQPESYILVLNVKLSVETARSVRDVFDEK